MNSSEETWRRYRDETWRSMIGFLVSSQQRLSDLIGPYRGTYRIVYRVLQPLLVSITSHPPPYSGSPPSPGAPKSGPVLSRCQPSRASGRPVLDAEGVTKGDGPGEASKQVVKHSTNQVGFGGEAERKHSLVR